MPYTPTLALTPALIAVAPLPQARKAFYTHYLTLITNNIAFAVTSYYSLVARNDYELLARSFDGECAAAIAARDAQAADRLAVMLGGWGTTLSESGAAIQGEVAGFCEGEFFGSRW